MLIDACWDVEGILAFVKGLNYQIVGCIATHFHIDHVGGIPPQPFAKFGVRVGGLMSLVDKLQVPAYIHSDDIDPLVEANPEFPRQNLVAVTEEYSLAVGGVNLLFYILQDTLGAAFVCWLKGIVCLPETRCL